MLQYLMLNVKFVVFPCLKRLVETSITFYCVIHKNWAPAGYKKQNSTTKYHAYAVKMIP